MRRLPVVLVLSALSVLATSPAPAQTKVKLGVDRLADGIPKVLEGKRVGLITNHTGRDRNRTPTIDLLAARKDMKLVALFAPEHGIRGVATGRINFETDEKTGLPVHSLFRRDLQYPPEIPPDVHRKHPLPVSQSSRDVHAQQIEY